VWQRSNFIFSPQKNARALWQCTRLPKRMPLGAKRDLLSKYGADAILRAGSHVEALAWKEMPAELTGFTIPEMVF